MQDDVLFVNFYYAEAVYAPLYHGYGEPDSFADRSVRAREWDRELLPYAPDMVLVHVTADPAAVAQAHGDPSTGSRHPQATRHSIRP